ncbi:helix-turn-helix transcriptional regulator [Gymnodinialimonas hymeniacidonis]|uniref:helix-turn-helix transcriptional regulator n=1 Tax=Gymnodinialimonas hymeniacidonis TaxID=3126508 RepID=UPI0034C6CBC7
MNYLTLSDLSTKLGGRSRSSIYRDIEAGRLPLPIKFGRRLYWAEADVDRAIQAFVKGSE